MTHIRTRNLFQKVEGLAEQNVLTDSGWSICRLSQMEILFMTPEQWPFEYIFADANDSVGFRCTQRKVQQAGDQKINTQLPFATKISVAKCNLR